MLGFRGGRLGLGGPVGVMGGGGGGWLGGRCETIGFSEGKGTLGGS